MAKNQTADVYIPSAAISPGPECSHLFCVGFLPAMPRTCRQFRNSPDRELTTGAKIDFQLRSNKAFRHVKTLFVQGNQVRTDQKRRFVLISTNLITLDE